MLAMIALKGKRRIEETAIKNESPLFLRRQKGGKSKRIPSSLYILAVLVFVICLHWKMVAESFSLVSQLWLAEDHEPQETYSFDKKQHRNGRTTTKKLTETEDNEMPKFFLDLASLPTNKSQNISIFYQIFVPNTGNESRHNALRIVSEQMAQVKNAIAGLPLETSTNPMHLYYLTMGEFPNQLNNTQFQNDHCNPHFTCHHIGHVLNGTEDDTLRHLHDFCRIHATNQLPHRVVYIHSKGSYHYKVENENWRFHLTAAATNPSCLMPTTECNVCGLQFFTEWTSFFPGNIWNADCSYIANLIPPQHFEMAVEEVVTEILDLKYRGILEMHLYTNRMDRFGLDRYHSEHWVGSHPDLIPCDMSKTRFLQPWLLRRDSTRGRYYGFGPGPRHTGGPADNLEPQELATVWNKYDRKREIFLLPGFLVKFSRWYQRYPRNNSWFWSFFPDGDFWRDIVARHKESPVLAALTNHTTSEIDLMFASNSTASATPSTIRASVKSPPTLVIFLRIDTRNLTSDMLHNQIGSLAKHIEEVKITSKILYYTFPDVSDEIKKLLDQHVLCAKRKCLEVIDSKEGDVFQDLYHYCQAIDSDIVMKASIKGEQMGDAASDGAMSTNEGALTSECMDCLKQNKCDVCGLELFADGDFVYRDYTWTARCSYINSGLLSPLEYARAMTTRVRRKVLLFEMGDKLHLNALAQKERYLPIGNDVLNGWITSHPFVRAKSITPIGSLWKDLSSATSSNITQFHLLLKDGSWRLRECAFFVCYLLRWSILYDEVPPESSFVWNGLFPDTRLWKSAVSTRGGMDAFLYVIEPLVNSTV